MPSAGLFESCVTKIEMALGLTVGCNLDLETREGFLEETTFYFFFFF